MSLILYRSDAEGDFEVEIPTKFEVCPRCQGRGTRVNPAVDGHGISAEEWENDWSEEDQETYMSGGYDVQCDECDGLRVVEIADESRMTPEDVEAWHEQERMEALDRAAENMERRYTEGF